LALAALTLMAVQAEPASPPPAPSAGGPPTIDSLLEQAPISEDGREAAVRAAYAAAQARRGGLDGRWRLEAGDGHALYVFQLSDPGDIPDPRSTNPQTPMIEGAWRDPGRQGAGGSGFLDSVRRDGAALILRFVDKDPAIVSLRQRPDGTWSGTISGAGAPRSVVLRRF
jgi:hypothetical protein